MDGKRWGVLLFVVLLCAGMAAWFLWHAAPVQAPPVTQAPPPPSVEPPPSSPDLSLPEPEVTTAAVAPAPLAVEGLALRGRVVDSRGEPLADAAVAVYEADHGAQRVFSDASGAFAVGNLAPVEYRVSAQKEHYNDAVEEKVRAGRDDVVLVLTDMSRASGRVVDDSGRPVAEFEITYMKAPPSGDALWREIVRNERTVWQEFSGPEGRFEVQDVASGAPFALGARAKGYEPAFVTVPAVEPGEAAEPAEIRLPAEATVAGTVLSPDRAPVAGAKIHLGRDADAPQIAESGPDGRFDLAGLGEAPLELTAAHDDYLPGTVQVLPKRGQAVPAEIVMGQGGSIEGTVMNGSQPAAGQTVAVSRLTPPRIRKQVVTGPDGRYSVAGIGLGTVDVLAKVVEAKPDAVPRRLHRQAEIEAGQTTVVDFVFPDAYATLEGTILVSGQAPQLAEIKGTVTNADGQSYFSKTADETGNYRIENIVPGSAWVEVSVRSQEGVELKKNFNAELAGGETVRQDVAFDAAGVVYGSLANLRPGDVGEVAAVPGVVQVDLSNIEGIMNLERIRAGQSEILEGGTYRIEGLEPGVYTLVAVAFSGEADTGDEALNSVRTAARTVTLPATGDVQADLSF